MTTYYIVRTYENPELGLTGIGKLPTPKGKWVCFTPSVTYLYETEAPTEKEAWSKLLKEASHMPYDGIEGFKERGYECEFISDSLLPDKTDDSLVLAKLFTDEKSAIVLANEIEALIQAERIKAKREVWTELLGDYADQSINLPDDFISVPSEWIKKQLAELDTPNKKEETK